MPNKKLSQRAVFDDSDFQQKFGILVSKVMPALLEKAGFQTGTLVIADAIKEEPRAPHKFGRLWNSQTIKVRVVDHRVEIVLGFNTQYAARLHEAPDGWNWTLDGSGPKYLSTKLARHKDDRYIPKFAAVIKAGMRN
jgi:hypothetical protein